MGRPLSRKYFGPQGGATADPTADGKDIHGTTVTSETGDTINENAYNMPLHMARIVGGQNEGGDDAPNDNLYIVAQKGSNRFKVSTSDGDGVCILADWDESSDLDEGEMVILGFVGSNSGSRVAIRKINGSKAYDFDNNAYKWYIDNDSSRNVLILTAI
jgi:hypothetical protein